MLMMPVRAISMMSSALLKGINSVKQQVVCGVRAYASRANIPGLVLVRVGLQTYFKSYIQMLQWK